MASAKVRQNKSPYIETIKIGIAVPPGWEGKIKVRHKQITSEGISLKDVAIGPYRHSRPKTDYHLTRTDNFYEAEFFNKRKGDHITVQYQINTAASVKNTQKFQLPFLQVDTYKINDSDYSKNIDAFCKELNQKDLSCTKHSNKKKKSKTKSKPKTFDKKQDVKPQENQGTSFHWQWVLMDWINIPSPKKYQERINGQKLNILDVDFETPKDIIKKYKDNGTDIICYMSVGTYENWRQDLKVNSDGVIDEPLNSGVPYSYDDLLGLYDDEFFIDINAFKLDKNKASGFKISYENHSKDDIARLKDIVTVRLKDSQEKGCDYIEFDNMDIHNFNAQKYTSYKSKTQGNKTGRPKKENQIAYVLWLSELVHAHGMQVVLKNAEDILDHEIEAKNKSNGLLGFVNAAFVIVEECVYWDLCTSYQKVAQKHDVKILAVEYLDILEDKNKSQKDACEEANRHSHIHMLVKKDRDLVPNPSDFSPCRK